MVLRSTSLQYFSGVVLHGASPHGEALSLGSVQVLVVFNPWQFSSIESSLETVHEKQDL
ncbi:MAG: hypothetical protein GY914_06625 [Prochlorococcus sp.]|nr:hypothetical protein [Prochlorococcus sp.]